MFYSPESNRRKRWYRLLTIGQKKLLALAVFSGCIVLSLLAVLIFYTTRAMDYDMGRVVMSNGQSMLYDSSNQPIASLDEDEEPPLQWQDLPQHLIDAFVAREDEDFFNHNGVVLSAVARSLVRNISSMRYEQGASTITMQLTRNVFELTTDKSLDRKMLEVMLAQRMERNYNKQTILLQYLDRIFFGQGCYGVRAAARRYFDKSVRDLDLGECAMLAGLVRGPSIFNPEHNMQAAIKVRNETLQRMLECEMITEEEFNKTSKETSTKLKRGEIENNDPTYPSMWARRELNNLLQQEAGKTTGIAVVSNLNLPLQQFLEQAVEDSLTAIEVPTHYPESWKALAATPEEAEEAQKAFHKMKRPKNLKVRGDTNDLTGLLQGCVLVVDARNSHRGNVLAVCGGRCAADGRDRWQEPVLPGRAAAPLVFCCACLPGGDNAHIVARSAEVTGSSLGYDIVRSFFESLHLENSPLPDRAHETDLYNGRFPLKKIELAKLLFSLQNQGRGYQLSLVNTIWSTLNRNVLYRYEPEKAPEYIRRESATTVSQLPPFVCPDGAPVCLSEALPDGMGQFSMVFRKKGICVFVWLGLDNPDDPNASSRELKAMLPKVSMNLARIVYEKAREEVRKQSETETNNK